MTLQAIDSPGDSQDIQEEDNRVPVWTTWSSRRGGGVAGPPASISLGFDVAACGRSLVILSVESGDGKDGVKAQQERGAGLAVKGERKRRGEGNGQVVRLLWGGVIGDSGKHHI